MAKSSDSGFVTLYLEKIILAVSLLVLVIAVVGWGLSAKQVTINNQPLAPSQVDEELAMMLKRKVGHKPPAVLPPMTDYSTKVIALQTSGLPSNIDMANLSAPVKAMQVDDKRVGTTKVQLAELIKVIPASERPLARVAAELRRTTPQPSDRLVAHLAVVYPIGKLSQDWGNLLQKSVAPATPTLLEVRAQRQELLTNGSWGDPAPVAAAWRPLLNDKGEQTLAPTIPDFQTNPNNAIEVQTAITAWRTSGWDRERAEPPYWDILGPDRQWVSWRINLPKNAVSNTAPEETFTVGSTPSPTVAPTMPLGPLMPPAGGAMMPAAGPPMGSAYRPSMPGPIMPGPIMPSGPTGTPPVASPAPGRTGVTTGTEIIHITPVPDWAQQTKDGNILVWVHDSALETLKVYRYRVQLVLVNPLLSYTVDSAVAEDAAKPLVETPWSDWSNPVSAPRDTEMFLTGSSELQNMVSVTVFARKLGQRVRETFAIRVGDTIGRDVDKPVSNPEKPENTINQKVDFSTGSVLLAIDWKRIIYRNGVSMPTVAISYLDETGRVLTRVFELDRYAARFQQLNDEATRGQPPIPEKKVPIVAKPPVQPPMPPKTGGPGPAGSAYRPPVAPIGPLKH